MPTVEMLMHGISLRTNLGSFAYCAITLIRGQKTTLVDSGHVGQRAFLINELKERGLTPSDIDVTVISHAHWDHAQNFDLFDSAPLLIHTNELRYARKPHRNDWATPRWTAAMLEFESKVQQVEEGYEIEPGVRIIHTPGHSAGTVAVVVETPDGPVAVTGDGIQNSEVALSGINPLVFWSEADASRSIARITEAAQTIYPGHDRPFHLLEGRANYLEPKRFAIMGLDVEEMGVSIDATPRPASVMPGIEEQTLDG
jgi:glyoxylase-like metal-dependent hydrolase (beta-lactamase superfamily II)